MSQRCCCTATHPAFFIAQQRHLQRNGSRQQLIGRRCQRASCAAAAHPALLISQHFHQDSVQQAAQQPAQLLLVSLVIRVCVRAAAALPRTQLSSSLNRKTCNTVNNQHKYYWSVSRVFVSALLLRTQLSSSISDSNSTVCSRQPNSQCIYDCSV